MANKIFYAEVTNDVDNFNDSGPSARPLAPFFGAPKTFST
jgi:hypothetical protein